MSTVALSRSRPAQQFEQLQQAVGDNRPYEGLSPAELDRLALEIGGLERALSAGGDLL